LRRAFAEFRLSTSIKRLLSSRYFASMVFLSKILDF
jgi:hypothetical protein